MEIKENKQPSIFTNTIILTLSALLCCALWGSATPFIRWGYELLLPEKNIPSTILFAGMRFTLAGIITVLIYSIGRKKFLFPQKESLPKIGLIALLQTIIQYIFFYIGVANTTGVKSAIASGSSAFFCVLVASLVFRQEKLTAKKIIACILGFAGIVIVNLNGLELSMNLLGDGFVIISTVSYAFSTVFMSRFSKSEDPVVISGYQFIFGGAFLLLLGLVLGGEVSLFNIGGVGVLIYLAFLSAIAYALWGMLVKFNPVSKVSIFVFTTPVFGTLLSLIMLPESSGVEPLNLIATLILISSGIILLNYQPKKK